VNKGEAVLNIGSGGTPDSMVAARMAGPEGKVVGVDDGDPVNDRKL